MKTLILFVCSIIALAAANAFASHHTTSGDSFINSGNSWLIVKERMKEYDAVQITDRRGLALEDRQGYTVTSPVPAGVQIEETAAVVVMPEQPVQPVLAGTLTVGFATNSATLGPKGVHKIQEFVQNLEDTNVRGIKIAGFADSRGNADYNQELSGARAENVANFLRESGIDNNLVTVEAGGEVVSDSLADARVVEIVVTK